MSEVTTETTGTSDADFDAVESILFGKEPDAPVEEQQEAEEVPQETGEPEQEPADPEDDGDEPEEEQPRPKKRTTADRIKKLALDRSRQAEEIAALRAQVELLAGVKKEPLTTEKPSATDGSQLVRPDPEKYQYGTLDDKYMEDLADYKAALKFQEFEARLQTQQQEKAQQEAAERASATLQTKAAEIETAGAAKFEDFRERVVEGGQNGDFALTKEMFETLTEIPDVAPDILYYLASYPDESAKVAQMSLRQQAMWFGRLEAEIRAEAQEPPKPAPRKATSAPPPLTAQTRGAGSSSGPRLDDLEDPRALEAIEKLIFKQKR